MWYRLLGQIFGKEKISEAWRGHKWVPRNSEKVAMPWEKEYLKMEEGQEKDSREALESPWRKGPRFLSIVLIIFSLTY